MIQLDASLISLAKRKKPKKQNYFQLCSGIAQSASFVIAAEDIIAHAEKSAGRHSRWKNKTKVLGWLWGGSLGPLVVLMVQPDSTDSEESDKPALNVTGSSSQP